MTSLANKTSWLAKGIQDIESTNAIQFIKCTDIPPECHKDITYGQIVVAYCPHKKEPNRSCLTVGGNRINYSFDTSTPTEDLTTIEMLWNSVLSMENAKFITADVANFYLETPMNRP